MGYIEDIPGFELIVCSIGPICLDCPIGSVCPDCPIGSIRPDCPIGPICPDCPMDPISPMGPMLALGFMDGIWGISPMGLSGTPKRLAGFVSIVGER